MKKLTLIFTLMILSATVAFGQQLTSRDYTNLLVKEICNETNGTISYRSMDETDRQSLFIKLPSYYDLDLSIMILNQVINQYSDIQLYSSWEKDEDGDYRAFWVIKDTHMFGITYLTEYNGIIFTMIKQ